jgi:hypothetical protein
MGRREGNSRMRSSEVFCSCIECWIQNTWMTLNGMVGGIYSHQPLSSHWLFLLAMDAPDIPMAYPRKLDIHQSRRVQAAWSPAGPPVGDLSSSSSPRALFESPGPAQRMTGLTVGVSSEKEMRLTLDGLSLDRKRPSRPHGSARLYIPRGSPRWESKRKPAQRLSLPSRRRKAEAAESTPPAPPT